MTPEKLLYAKTHEWAYFESADGQQVATIGISAFAVEALTDLVFIELPAVGRQLQAGESFGEIESVKAVSDLYSPVTGEVVAVNEALRSHLEVLNTDPYTAGWMLKIKVTSDAGRSELLDYAAYQRNAPPKVTEKNAMPYIANTPQDQRAMLDAIGLDSLADLFAEIPADLRLNRSLQIPPALGELELTAHMSQLAGQNASASDKACFLGAGSYDHFIPAVVDYVGSRGEFYTSYTPYQPEASQGNLQVFFEYQTLIAELTGMDVSNASLYDGGSAVAEAVLMAISATGRRGRVVTAGSVHPEYREILATYLTNLGVELITVPAPNGVVDAQELARAVNGDTACVLVQQPNFFGCLESVAAIAAAAHDGGALFVVSVDPISLGLLKRPGSYGADIVVAEGQSLGSPMSFGGPYLGIMACRETFVRRMPGRIAGQTVDRRGQRCWVLTLQTREQHIRREKATSNICTNQGLFALRATVYLAAMGPQGMREVAELCLHKARYAQARLSAVKGLRPAFAQPTFKEFVIRATDGQVPERLSEALDAGYLAGVPLARWYDDLADCFLVTVTEKRTRAEIDGLAASLNLA